MNNRHFRNQWILPLQISYKKYFPSYLLNVRDLSDRRTYYNGILIDNNLIYDVIVVGRSTLLGLKILRKRVFFANYYHIFCFLFYK
jgi:hypothetical protein